MAESYVTYEHFGEFAKRIDERFENMEKRMEQGFAHAEQARAQGFAHLNQRFEQVDKRFGDMTQSVNQRFDQVDRILVSIQSYMRQMRNWLVGLYGVVVFGFVGTIVLALLKD